MAKWFTETEIEGLDKRLVILLDQMREVAEIPIIITSGYRSPENNMTVGSVVPDSAHTKGLAVDIRCRDSISRYKLVWAAFKVGFKRIECATRHLHVDIDEEKPQNVLWLDVSK